MPRLPRKTAWQPAWTHSNRICFPASPIDTTTPQEKPETRDETHGCRKTSISCETSTNFDICETSSNRLECHKVPRLPRKTTWQPAWTHSNRRCFPASPIDTATPQENQDSRRHTWVQKKRGFRARLPPILIFSTRYQTGWNVTKCHACHTKRHDNLLGHIRIGDVF